MLPQPSKDDLEATEILAALRKQLPTTELVTANEELPKGSGRNEQQLGTRERQEDPRLVVVTGPWSHQLKDSTILPVNVLDLQCQNLSASDFISITLVCDPGYGKRTSIFLGAVAALSHDSRGVIQCPTLKVSKAMLPGRTKGFQFRLKYALISGEEETATATSEAFSIWANAYQDGFPLQEHEMHIQHRAATNRKKRMVRRRHLRNPTSATW
jgi:hypothetical protein